MYCVFLLIFFLGGGRGGGGGGGGGVVRSRLELRAELSLGGAEGQRSGFNISTINPKP